MYKYKINVLLQCLEDMENDEYCKTRLKGDNTKWINIEKEELLVLIDFYNNRSKHFDELHFNMTD